jgi:hypothetical protein
VFVVDGVVLDSFVVLLDPYTYGFCSFFCAILSHVT